MCNVTFKKKDDRDWAELEIVKVICFPFNICLIV